MANWYTVAYFIAGLVLVLELWYVFSLFNNSNNCLEVYGSEFKFTIKNNTTMCYKAELNELGIPKYEYREYPTIV